MSFALEDRLIFVDIHNRLFDRVPRILFTSHIYVHIFHATAQTRLMHLDISQRLFTFAGWHLANNF
jgi:hypothetical protein